MHVGLRQKFGQKHHLTFVGSIRSTAAGVPILKTPASTWSVSCEIIALHPTSFGQVHITGRLSGHLDRIGLECFLEMQRPKILAASSAIVFAFQNPPVSTSG